MPTKRSIMFTAYVIENQKGQHYIGQTENLEQRLVMHNSLDPQTKKFHNTTFARGPWKIVFTKEFNKRTEALAYEKFLKSGEGRRYLFSWLEQRPSAVADG